MERPGNATYLEKRTIMRINRYTSSALCFLSLIGALRAQAPPTPLPTQSSAASDTPTTQSPGYQLTVRVNRVVLDVVVTDAKGKTVEGLKQDDFKVLEDGVVQPLRFFDVHAGTLAGSTQQALDLHLPPDTFSNLTLAPPAHAEKAGNHIALRHAEHASGGVALRPPGIGKFHQRSEELDQHRDLCADRPFTPVRSEEHTSELQSLRHLVCRLLLE